MIDQDYVDGLERENRFMADLLARMAGRNLSLTEQRNTYWRKCNELQRALERAEAGYRAALAALD